MFDTYCTVVLQSDQTQEQLKTRDENPYLYMRNKIQISTYFQNICKLEKSMFSTNWNKFGETFIMMKFEKALHAMFGIIYNSSAFNANEQDPVL